MFKRLWLGLKVIFGGTLPHSDSEKLYLPNKKYYLFNETGNILICTTEKSVTGFEEDIRSAFNNVTVFFAAMTKALSQTINPVTNKPFSTYNYQAIKNVFASSGLFVETSKEVGVFRSPHIGEKLGQNFVEHILNREFDRRTLSFTRGMFSGMRKQHEVADGAELDPDSNKMCRGGQVFFVCELLCGVPTTSVVLVTIEPKSGVANTQDSTVKAKSDGADIDILDIGSTQQSRRKEKGIVRDWAYKKRTYLFISPQFIMQSAGNLNPDNYSSYEELVDAISDDLLKKLNPLV
ncbi:hypothetical protein HG263_20225 [Pseudoalteromonas sp. JBTF-M23]|uniref:Uncharacterized protein n=1 Tax=Pseudoalteromonas caenipelagi TaxID=2726988 RepID=A0A849VGI0_9GAMM|nr:hypothetical protein [Pseudoalteromonas caenipelagi]NOU52839.1 hypothetical protein [Pseudoalteromonas caenipelagi]